MTKKPKPVADREAAPPRGGRDRGLKLPSEGGSYVHRPDGALEKQPHPKALEAPVKEA